YSKYASEIMIANKAGKIINIGSINGLRGREGSVAYSTAKAGIIGFTKTIAKELGKYNICCNVVAPGFINTDGQSNTSELIKKMVLDECAIRKLTEPAEIANLVLFLSSEKANNITGQVYQIDCGQYI
ncbi:MAG TPA: SDR family oxidoreductase, partial [Candidatus Diapherotrites archaeon]|nr:SDR family oxidoreductase [Candidatus Diapherotrites archaeon]